MSEQQLRRDLHRRTQERMKTVINDTFDLYEMAGLETLDAITALADVLMQHTARVLASSEGDAKSCGLVIEALVRFERGEIDEQMVKRIMGAIGQHMRQQQR